MKALNLRQVPDLTARAFRALGQGRWLEVDCGEETLRLTLGAPLPPARPEDVPTLPLSSPHGVICLSNADALLSLWGDVPVLTAADAQAWYWQLINQHLAPALQDLFSPLQPLNEPMPEPGGLIQCALCTQRAGETVRAVLSCSADTLLRLFAATPWQWTHQPLPESWPLVCPLIVGHLSLTANELRSLHEGDVLLADNGSFDINGYGRVPLGDQQWAVSTARQNDQLQLRLIHKEPLDHER